MFALTTAYTIVQLVQLWASFGRLEVDAKGTHAFDAKVYWLESVVFAINVRSLVPPDQAFYMC